MSHNKGPRSKFTLRTPRSLHERLKAAAASQGQDLNTWIEEQLQEQVRFSEMLAIPPLTPGTLDDGTPVRVMTGFTSFRP